MPNRNKRQKSKLTALERNLADILGADSLDEMVGLARLRRAWPLIVGDMMAARTEPVQFEATADGCCLWVAVDHSIMAQQIRFLRDDIRKACFKHANIGKITHIRSRMVPGAGIKPAVPRAKPRNISFKQKRKLASELASIKDHRLRRAAFQARMAQLQFSETTNEELI